MWLGKPAGDGVHQRVRQGHAHDRPQSYGAFEKLHALIQTEPDDLGPEAKGMMAAIGIEKGKPFNPDAR